MNPTVSKSRKRRVRKRKKKQILSIPTNTMNASTKFQNEIYMNKFKRFAPKHLHNMLLCGYIRNISPQITSIDIQSLCSSFLPPFITWKCNKFEHLIARMRKKYTSFGKYTLFNGYWSEEEWTELLFADTFNSLKAYQKRIVCRNIISKKCFFDRFKLTVMDEYNLQFVEYILVKKYKMVKQIDLSNLDLNDEHVLYLCNMFENIVKHHRQTAKERIESKQNKNLKQKPEIKRRQRQRNRKHIENITLNLKVVNLSLNKKISGKYLGLMLRTIKKYIPQMDELLLSATNITNKCIQTIMKHNIYGLMVNLTDCKGVTLKALNKYIRSDYEDDIPTKYVYCKTLIYFANKKENAYQNQKRKSAKHIKGKGRKYKRSKRALDEDPPWDDYYYRS